MKKRIYEMLLGCAAAMLIGTGSGCGVPEKTGEETKAEETGSLPEPAAGIGDETAKQEEMQPAAGMTDSGSKKKAELYRENTDGTPVQGWYTDEDGTTGYCDTDGYLLTGFQMLDGFRYLFTEEGDMITGAYTLENGERILFTEDGKQYRQSAAVLDGALCFFNEEGYLARGQKVTFLDGATGITDDEGRLYTGSHRFGDEIYTFTSQGKLRHILNANTPMVALTYDDGPSNQNTPVILDVLRANNAYATFFVLGRNVERCSDVIQAIEDSGSEIGNHTYNHFKIVNMDAQLTEQEISSTSSYVQMITENRPSLMRPPTGETNEVSCANVAAVDSGYPIIMWSVDTLDWQHRDAATTCQTIRSQVRDGSIVLMHDMEASSAAASQIIIPELIGMGYQLVSVSELAAARGGMTAGKIYHHFYPEDVPEGLEFPLPTALSGESPSGGESVPSDTTSAEGLTQDEETRQGDLQEPETDSEEAATKETQAEEPVTEETTAPEKETLTEESAAAGQPAEESGPKETDTEEESRRPQEPSSDLPVIFPWEFSGGDE